MNVCTIGNEWSISRVFNGLGWSMGNEDPPLPY
jgi:hypothetical protein